MLGRKTSHTCCVNPFVIQIGVFSLATKKAHILAGTRNDALKFTGDRFFLLNFMLFTGAHYLSND